MDFLKTLGIKTENSGAFCANDWLQTKGHSIESINPATGEAIARVHGCTLGDYDKIRSSSYAAFKQWQQVPAPKRGELVRLIGQKLREYKDALGSLVALEMGKIKQEGNGEVQEMIDMADFAVGQARMLYGLSMHSERPQHRMYEQWHPLGSIGVITSFNFPVAVWAWNAFIAAICGNTVIWKPSSKTPLCAIAVMHICQKAMQELGVEGIFSLMIAEDHDVTTKLVNDEYTALVSFTGSTKVGRHINEQVAKRLGRVLLELGGNNAIIIDETADLNLAIPAVVFGAVGTAGQRCTTTRRLFIHESIFDEVTNSLAYAYRQVKIGDPLAKDTLMGPLIDEKAVYEYEAAIEEATHLGAEIVVGGARLQRAGYFVEPTIIKAKNEWPLVQRETFAPILYVIPFKQLSDAIQMQNDVAQGLSSALFTNSLRQSEYYLSSLGSDCGIANINIGTSGAEIGGAFGGEKDTGGGREAGSDAWKFYMRRQTNTINWGKTLPLAQGIKFDI